MAGGIRRWLAERTGLLRLGDALGLSLQEDLARRTCLRVERQTTLGFPALGRALFTIRSFIEPLPLVMTGAWRRERFAAALRGMDAESLAYKGLPPTVRDSLVA